MPRFVLSTLVLLALQVARNEAAQVASQGQAAAPSWMAWKVFHDSLVFYSQRPGSQLNKMLAAQYGLGSAEAQLLMSAGQTYLDAIKRIEMDAKAEAQRRYGNAVPASSPPKEPVRRSSISDKSVRERALEDGLYAQVEAVKQAVLDGHIRTLQAKLDALQFDRIRQWVENSVTPRIKILTAPSQALPPK